VFELYGEVPEIRENAERALAGEQVTFTVELGGAAYESLYSPLLDGEGKADGLIGVSMDWTTSGSPSTATGPSGAASATSQTRSGP
jgi:arginase family enzyme